MGRTVQQTVQWIWDPARLVQINGDTEFVLHSNDNSVPFPDVYYTQRFITWGSCHKRTNGSSDTRRLTIELKNLTEAVTYYNSTNEHRHEYIIFNERILLAVKNARYKNYMWTGNVMFNPMTRVGIPNGKGTAVLHDGTILKDIYAFEGMLFEDIPCQSFDEIVKKRKTTQ